ncbi:MAG: CpaF family protein, partial [Candidatus Omnitrophica bacterium]|nr:CpaF family protein [Candidatus Omnitrophota bacterium]
MIKVLKTKVRDKVIVEYGRLFSSEDISVEEFKDAITQTLNSIIHYEHVNIQPAEKEKIIRDLLNDFLGFGPVDALMKDPHVSEIMINGPKKIFVERNGKTELSDIIFEDDKHLMYLIHKILSPTRRRVDEAYPYTDISLKDGSRINIIIPPLALDGPMVTIR